MPYTRPFPSSGTNKPADPTLVRDWMHEQGFKISDSIPPNSTLKFKVICPGGHIWYTTLSSLRQGVQCLTCVKEIPSGEILRRLAVSNVKLVSNYEHSGKPIKVECLRCGKQRSCRLNKLVDSECPGCLSDRVLERSAQKWAAKYPPGYRLKQYGGADGMVSMICPDGHEFTISAYWYRKTKLCPKCSQNEKLQNLIEVVRKDVERSGFRWVRGEIRGAEDYITVQCQSCGDESELHVRSRKHYLLNCNKCLSHRIKEGHTKNFTEALEGEGYKLVSEYRHSETPVLTLCPSGHKYTTSADRWNAGARCFECCLRGTSSYETEMSKWLESRGLGVQRRYRELGVEIDIFLPDYNLGIEVHGLYWHSIHGHLSERRRENLRSLHRAKYEVTQKAGVRLIQIYEDQWRAEKSAVQNYLMDAIQIALIGHWAGLDQESFRAFFGQHSLQKINPYLRTYEGFFANGVLCAVYGATKEGQFQFAGPPGLLSGVKGNVFVSYNEESLDQYLIAAGFRRSNLQPVEYFVTRKRRLYRMENTFGVLVGAGVSTWVRFEDKTDSILESWGYQKSGASLWSKEGQQTVSIDLIRTGAINIRKWELQEKTAIVESILTHKAGRSKRAPARSLRVIELDNRSQLNFFSANHLMGGVACPAFALADRDGQIMCALSYKVRDSKAGIYEIMRFATLLGFSVPGGLSRLIAALTRKCQPSQILSFVDLRYGDGRSLEELGFRRQGVSAGWQWTNGYNCFNRLSCRANMDARLLPQSAHALELGWWKIGDSGQAKFIKTLRS